MTTLAFSLLELSPFVISDSDNLLISFLFEIDFSSAL